MTKYLHKLEIEANFLYLRMGIFGSPTANITFNAEINAESFASEVGNKTTMPVINTST